jgi:6-phosphogluconolactonase
MKKEIKIFDNNEEINSFLIKRIKKIINYSTKENKFCTIALSGGNTPILFYHELSRQTDINWDNVHFFIVDERFIPIGHKDNNFTNIKKTLFDYIKIPVSNIHFVVTNTGNLLESSEKYNLELKSFFKLNQSNPLPVFDLIILGLGTDGHTASLFPGTDALIEKNKLATFSKPENISYERITLTIPVINNSKNIIFLVTGKDKKDIVKKILAEKANLPAAKINPENGKLFFILDKFSASEII